MNIKDYRFGIIKTRRVNVDGRYALHNLGVCSCGQHLMKDNAWSTDFECDSCGNDYFIDATRQNGKRFVIPYIEVIRKDNRGFKIKRINLSVTYDGFLEVVKKNLTRTMDYDIIDKRLKVWREDELEYDYDTHFEADYLMSQVNSNFFRQLETDDFIGRVGNEVTTGLYKVAKKLSNVGWNKKQNIIKGLVRLMKDYQWMQILANAGIPEVDRFHHQRYFYNKNNEPIDSTKTKPHQILKVPKFALQYIREDVTIDYHVLKSIQGHLGKIDQNKMRDIMSIVKDESTMSALANSLETVMQIHIDYDYTNLKKLVLYLFREVRLTQGIDSPNTASTYLRDYVRMSRAMGLEYEKYPKSLKKVHDVVQMNYNIVHKSSSKDEEFKVAIEKKSYQNLTYMTKDSKYAVIAPKESEDLIKEGNQLSHCVASYVKDVANDKCKILFLREVDEIDKPLATIEVRGLNIRQARGYANRPLNDEQREFVKQWAEKMNLYEAYY